MDAALAIAVTALLLGGIFAAVANTLFLLTLRWHRPRSRSFSAAAAALVLVVAVNVTAPAVVMRCAPDAGVAAAECLALVVLAAASFVAGRRRVPAGGRELLPGIVASGSLLLGTLIAGGIEWILRGPAPTPAANAVTLAFLLVLAGAAAVMLLRRTLP